MARTLDERLLPGVIALMLLFIHIYGLGDYPDNIVLIWGLFPMKVKHMMILMGIMEFALTPTGMSPLGGDNISHVTHLSGLVVAYVFLSIKHREWDIRRWPYRR